MSALSFRPRGKFYPLLLNIRGTHSIPAMSFLSPFVYFSEYARSFFKGNQYTKVLKDNLSLTGTNDTAKGPERTKCPFGESRKYIVK